MLNQLLQSEKILLVLLCSINYNMTEGQAIPLYVPKFEIHFLYSFPNQNPCNKHDTPLDFCLHIMAEATSLHHTT